jgi:hypothetical protein
MAIRLLDESYSIIDVPIGLQRKLNETFKQRVRVKEIVDKSKIVTNLIGAYAVRRVAHKARFYVMDVVTQKMGLVLNRQLGSEKINVRTILEKLNEKGIKVFLKGGVVRDIFTGVDSIDVDAIFDSNIYKVKAICDEEGWLVDNLAPKFQSMNIGGAKGVSIDLVNLKATFMSSDIEHEFTVNDLVFDWRANVLIDVSGYGLFDVINRIIRISPTPNLYNKWASNDWKKPLRYFKLLMKGYKPMTPKLHEFVVGYIENNIESVYFQTIYENVSRIKHFLIKNITNGIINTDGSYEYGVNKRGIHPFLMEMKKHLSAQVFLRIISILRASSHDRYIETIMNKVSKNKKLTMKIKRKSIL